MANDIVLVHGAGGNASTWAPVRAHWAWAHDLHAIDLPGRGSSPGPPCATAAEAATWLARHLDPVATPSPVVVGHSYGGAVALSLALEAPGRVRGIVLVSSGGRLRVHPAILQAVSEATPERPFHLDLAFGPGVERAVVDAHNARSGTTPPASTVADWRACDTFDVLARLGKVTVPVLVVHGAEDALTPPKHQRRLAEALPRATRVEVPGAGHMLPWEAPAAVADAVRDWMEEIP